MNLNTAPNERTQGKRIAPKGRDTMTKTAAQPNALRTTHTATNLTDVRCPQCGFHIIEGECLDTLTETPQKPVQARVEPQLRRMSASHYMVDSSRLTLVTYDQRPNELGVWECTCAGYAYRHECRHVAKLLSVLGVSVVAAVPAKRKLTLEMLYEDVA